MDFPVYDMQTILPKPVMDWCVWLARQYGVHETVVVNALLMYAMYEITNQESAGMAKLSEFIQTINTSTPVPERRRDVEEEDDAN